MTLTITLALVLSTPNFPAKVAALSGGPAPACALCHQGGVTGRGTVTTPFGAALRERGLLANDEASLATAWAAMRGVDSDGDGTTDTDELTSGADPNAGATTLTPEYGCTTTPSWPLVAMLVACLRRRRQTKHDTDS